MKLTATNVNETFMKCLFEDDEPKDNAVISEGIMRKFGFNPKRLHENEENIFSMLQQLPNEFMESGGGGMSFLNACNDKDGNQWSDLHQTMEQLLVLGIAIGKARIQFPREMWSAFPGGVPYFVVLNKVAEVA